MKPGLFTIYGATKPPGHLGFFYQGHAVSQIQGLVYQYKQEDKGLNNSNTHGNMHF